MSSRTGLQSLKQTTGEFTSQTNTQPLPLLLQEAPPSQFNACILSRQQHNRPHLYLLPLSFTCPLSGWKNASGF